MIETKRLTIDQIAHKSEELPSIEKGHKFVETWKANLLGMVDVLAQEHSFKPEAVETIKAGINTWAEEDPDKKIDHGAFHSYFVYEGMKYLADKEGVNLDDSSMQTMAVLHDLVQSMPAIDISTGEALKGINLRETHATQMALLIRKFGKNFGLDHNLMEELVHSIGHHDDVYTGRRFEPRFKSATLLSDADKLYGAGLEHEPLDLAIAAMKRNLKNSSGENGWYLLRDLSPEERQSWKYGLRWYSDAVSAVRADLSGDIYLTETAKQIAKDRLANLDQAISEFYGSYFDTQLELVNNWNENLELAEVVGNGSNAPDIKNLNQSQIINKLYQTPLDMEPKYQKTGKSGYGFKLKIGENVLDPSVARFMFDEDGEFNPIDGKQRFLEALREAFE